MGLERGNANTDKRESTYEDLYPELAENKDETPAIQEEHATAESNEASEAPRAAESTDREEIEAVRERLQSHGENLAVDSVDTQPVVAEKHEDLKQQKAIDLIKKFSLEKDSESGDRWSMSALVERLERGENPRTVLLNSLGVEETRGTQERKKWTNRLMAGVAVPGAGVMIGAPLLAAFGVLSAPVAIPVAIGGLAVAGAGAAVAGLTRLGMKVWHRMRQNRHKKEIDKVAAYV